MSDYISCNINELVGKILVEIKIKINDNEDEENEILFLCENGETYKMFHEQDCCEYVTINDICGNIQDLIGSPIAMAEEVTEYNSGLGGSCTWTFYKLATVKEYVTIRWYGESNGNYSESVDFIKFKFGGK